MILIARFEGLGVTVGHGIGRTGSFTSGSVTMLLVHDL